MEQIESNKRYIRDNVPDRLQANFYEYFLQLPDQENFNQWSLSRTIEVNKNIQRLFHNLIVCTQPKQKKPTKDQLKAKRWAKHI